MSKSIHPLALFRLSVLGPLASRDHLERGELKQIIRELASKTYQIPGSKRTHLSPQIIERWYYLWERGGIAALEPKIRCDKNDTQLSEAVQSALLAIKQDNPARSLNTLISMLEKQGIVAKGKLARATVHRFLQRLNLSKRTIADAPTIERRSFVATYSGDLWQGDVLHGPQISTPNGMRKTYLVSLLDDASRLITHCAFCLGETAIDIEGVLKDAVLKRGIPKKLIVDNGAAYKSGSLQSICARLQIRLIYCPAREPQAKGKLERYHRFFREMFLNEMDSKSIQNLADLNARLWVWIETIYHQRPHGGLENKITPLERWRQDLIHIRQLGPQALMIDDLFYHRISRFVRKDGTVAWNGKLFEVPYELSGKTIHLVFDPHTQKAIRVESDTGDDLGPVILLDTTANLYRKRQRPEIKKNAEYPRQFNAVEMAYQDYSRSCSIVNNDNKENL
jgi:putative transposase